MKLTLHDSIHALPPQERPREKLAARGVSALTDHELLALMIGSGNRNRGVERVASDLLDFLDLIDDVPEPSDLLAVEGIGPARSALICAALEYARRRFRPARRRIGEPADVLPLLSHWSDRPQEHFLTLSLNGAHEVLRVRMISRGILDRTVVHPREVYADPLSDRAAAVIVAHNHPSGKLEPSTEDRELTDRLRGAGDLLGIPLLDHVIFSTEGFYSFLERGEL